MSITFSKLSVSKNFENNLINSEKSNVIDSTCCLVSKNIENDEIFSTKLNNNKIQENNIPIISLKEWDIMREFRKAPFKERLSQMEALLNAQ